MSIEYWKRIGDTPIMSSGTIMNVGNSPTAVNESITQNKTDIPFTEIGQVLGGIIGGVSFGWTYPIVWLDGPLPIIDALWLGGLAYSINRGIKIGGNVGKVLDNIETVIT